MEAAAAAVEREGKSVLDALKDLHTHFGAGAGAPGAAQANVVEGPPRLGKVRLLLILLVFWARTMSAPRYLRAR